MTLEARLVEAVAEVTPVKRRLLLSGYVLVCLGVFVELFV
jgi:hypothetical protein